METKSYIVCYLVEKTVLNEYEDMLVNAMEKNKIDISKDFHAILEYNYKPLYDCLVNLGGEPVTTSTYKFINSKYANPEELLRNITYKEDLEYDVKIDVYEIYQNKASNYE